MKSILILTYLVLCSNLAIAKLEFEDASHPELITSGRALAMGNAYLSKVDDGWASFYNPAGLGSVRGLQSHLVNIHLESNSGFLDITGNGAVTNSISKYSSAFDPVSLRQLHVDNPGNISHARMHAFPNITFRGITLGYVYSKQNRARLKSVTDDFEVSERVDSGPVFSLSASLFGGVLKFGASVTHLTRKQLQKDFASGDPVSIDASTDYKQGNMTHIVAGTRLTLPITALPTFSAVLRNSSGADWDTPELGGTPDKIPQTFDYGFSITPNIGRTFRIHIEADIRDAGNRYENVPSQRKMSLGIEFDYMRSMFVRFGYGDGWGTAGVGVRNKDFIFDLSTYAIEASEDGVREDEDRRFLMSISGGI
jgi:hypothetical protein